MLSNYKNLKSDMGYIRLIIANAISAFGSSIDNIAFTWLVYELTADPVWIAVIAGASMFPMLVMQSFIAVWVERQNKKVIMMLADLSGAIIMVLVAVLYLLNLLNPVLLLIITLVNATVETIRTPAGVAFVPHILSKENYEVGTGLSQSSSQIAAVIGLAVTGVIVATFGIYFAFIVDALTFIISFLIIMTIKHKEEKHEKVQGEKGRFIKEYKEGLKTFYGIKKIFYVCMIAVAINFLSSAINTYSALFIGDYLKLSVDIYAYASIAITGGTVIGGLLAGFVCDKISSKNIFVISGLFMAAIYVIWVLCTFISVEAIKISVLLLVCFIFGISSGVLSVTVSASFMKAVPKQYLARIAGIFNSLATACTPISAVVLALFSMFIGVDMIFIVFAVLTVIYALFVFANKKINLEDDENVGENTKESA